MSEHDPEYVPTDDDLDIEGPNEEAPGDDLELDDDLEGLEDDDGYGEEDEDY